MKKIILICICQLLIILSVFKYAGAENFQWVKNETINLAFNPDLANFISEADNSGNSYLASLSYFRLNFGLSYYGNVSVKKFNSSSGQIYTKILTGKVEVSEIETDYEGNVYVSGSFMDTLIIDSLNIILNTGSGFNINYFIIKFNKNGLLLWKKNINSSYNANYQLNCLKVKNNNIYLGLQNVFDGYIKKMDLNGVELLSIRESQVRSVTGIDIDNFGNIYAAGACSSGNILFGNQYNQTSFIYNIYFVKYDASGDYIWSKFVEDVTFQSVNIVCDYSGNLIACGDLLGGYLFGNLQTFGPQWVYDFFVTKIDPSGNFLWVFEVPNTAILTGDAGRAKSKSIDVDYQNNIYFTGFLRSTLNLGNGVIVTSSGSREILMLKFNKDGLLLSGKTSGGAGSDRPDCLSIDNAGNLFLSGNFSGTAQFDTITVVGSGNINSFLAKIHSGNQNGNINLTAAIQGFYDSNSDKMNLSDTVIIYLRNSVSPYTAVDSSKSVLHHSSLSGVFNFQNASAGNYYIHFKHRNSIETWSSSPLYYSPGNNVDYNFTSDASRAFGNNLIQVDSSPLIFAVYNGDVNQDGIADASDIMAVDNDALNSVTGYVNTDLTGDLFVDASDLGLEENNASLGITAVIP